MRSLFVMAARLKASAEGRSLEDMADLMWLEHRDAVHLICGGKNVDSFHLLLKAGGGLIICRRDQGLRGATGYCRLGLPIVQRKKL